MMKKMTQIQNDFNLKNKELDIKLKEKDNKNAEILKKNG